MPEGPEIRRAADRVAKAIGGQRLTNVFFEPSVFPTLARRGRALVGQRVLRIDTHGKAMLTRLDGGLTIYSHNQLYGRWFVRQRDHLPDTNRSLRLALHTETHSALLYSASEIDLLDVDGLAMHPFLSKLGPDILDPTLTWQQLRQRSQDRRFSGRSLAALYLDQSYIAGVGNYLRSEILFYAGLDPWAKPSQLTSGALGKLARTTLTIGQRAYATGGVTNPPRRVAALRRALPAAERAAPRRQREATRFAVFDRAEQPCYDCGDMIERVEVSARRLYFCPVCQGSNP